MQSILLFLFIGAISPKKEFKIQQFSDFGGFQLLEVKKNKSSNLYNFLYSV